MQLKIESKIVVYILSCHEREEMRKRTIANLQMAGYAELPRVEIDQTTFTRRQERQERTSLRLLQRALLEISESDFILFLEDDLEFNRHLFHNLGQWRPLRNARPGQHFFGSLYNPNIRALTRRPDEAFFIADPEAVYGSQAVLLSAATARYVIERWEEVAGMQDIKMSRLAAKVCPLYFHTPSLAQHVGYTSVWGGHYHWTEDFSQDWRA